MKSFSPELVAFLQSGFVAARDLIWLSIKDGAGNPFSYGFWSGVENRGLRVLNPLTGLANTRPFEGAGSLIKVDGIANVSNLTTQEIGIQLSLINDSARNIVRQYRLKRGRIEIYRAFFDKRTNEQFDVAHCRFQGFINSADERMPANGDVGYLALSCSSHTEELTRANAMKRSQISEDSPDTFYRDIAVAHEWEVFWGRHNSKQQKERVWR